MIDKEWAEGLERLAAANAKATAEYLRSLTAEEAIAQFEELTRCVHREWGDQPLFPRPPSPGLAKFWKKP